MNKLEIYAHTNLPFDLVKPGNNVITISGELNASFEEQRDKLTKEGCVLVEQIVRDFPRTTEMNLTRNGIDFFLDVDGVIESTIKEIAEKEK